MVTRIEKRLQVSKVTIRDQVSINIVQGNKYICTIEQGIKDTCTIEQGDKFRTWLPVERKVKSIEQGDKYRAR